MEGAKELCQYFVYLTSKATQYAEVAVVEFDDDLRTRVERGQGSLGSEDLRRSVAYLHFHAGAVAGSRSFVNKGALSNVSTKLNKGRRNRAGVDQKPQTSVCFAYNTAAGCQRQNCAFPHECLVCNNTKHTAAFHASASSASAGPAPPRQA